MTNPEKSERSEFENFTSDMTSFLKYIVEMNNERTSTEIFEKLFNSGVLKNMPIYIVVKNSMDGDSYTFGEAKAPLQFELSSTFEMKSYGGNEVTVKHNFENLSEENLQSLAPFAKMFQETKGTRTILNFIKDELKGSKSEVSGIKKVQEYVERTGDQTLVVLDDYR